MPNYVRIVRRGSHNVRVLLEDGNTQLVPVSALDSWTCIGGNVQPISNASSTPSRSTFVNPDNQRDRVYVRVTRHGSRNTTVELQDGSRIHVPNEILSNSWIRYGSAAYRSWEETLEYPEGRSITDLTFGVELEFVANPDKYNDFCMAMRDTVGADRFMDPMRYGCSSVSKWSLQIDASVRSTSAHSNKRGYELTSPILKFNNESKEELLKVLTVITTVFEGIVNRTCGTHIHIGNFARISNDPIFMNKASRFQKLYGKFESTVFDRIVSPSRRGMNNHYCKSCNVDYTITERYHKINLKKLHVYGTIENRQHQGTLELIKIWSWMEINGKFILKYFNNPDTFNDYDFQNSSLEDFTNFVELDQTTKDFFLMRESELNA